MSKDHDYRKRVGKRIRRIRKERKLSQAKLAEMIGVTDNYISNWELGKHMPSPRYLEALGRALGVPAETFLGR